MAKGITETDVHHAADALVAAGGRPTVEGVRRHLGTGSPNTVTRWLDTWWQGLGDRLATAKARRAFPDAPSLVETLVGELWDQALTAARSEAENSLASDRDVLTVERAAVEQQLAQGLREIEAHQVVAVSAERGRAAAEARLADAERLIEHQIAQLADLADQRSTLLRRIEASEGERGALAQRLQEQEAAAATERGAQAQYVRALEDRSHAEVDRVRQEANELRRQVEALRREHANQEQKVMLQLEQARAGFAEALRDVAIHQSRADAMERQLAQLVDLPAVLQAALSQARESNTRRPEGAAKAKRPMRHSRVKPS